MTQNPILKVLSTLGKHRVRYLLMGGQACVWYGAAEFSRDADVVVLADAENLSRIRKAMKELKADVIAVPPFQVKHLRRGHAVHFRCHHLEAENLRVDIMAVMRGVDPFEDLWERRTTITRQGINIELLDWPDLVQAKKTQRSKDWPMIQRLMEVHYFKYQMKPNRQQVDFWLRECRTASILLDLAKRFPKQTKQALPKRPLLSLAVSMDAEALTAAVDQEEKAEREADRIYWAPLRQELERLRHQRVRKGKKP